ncbi:MAG: Cna B-type domain-containing protein, partial [Erysipelotrichaceae bacterium]|nr:Cna B-type domain-containing protein [Erysipelotrichaceae bacterium]
ITNKHITEETEVSVIKTWDDKDDQDGVRPESVEFTLYANGKEIGSITLDGTVDENGEKEAWKATWEKLPVNEAGKPIKYTVKETSSDVNYTVIYPDHEEEYAADGEAITNKHVPGTVGVSAKKVWDDNDDQDGIRPASVEFTLYADGTKVSSIVLDGKVDTTGEFEAWVASWKELPEKKDGVTIEYTVKETSTAVDYEVIYEDGKAYAVDGGTITNKHVPETIVLHIEKIWKDDDDRQGKRPATITVNLLADAVVFDTIVIKSDLNGDWHYDSEELPKYKDGKEIKYSITEETVPDYMTDITGSAADGFIITNTVGVDTADRTHLPLWICLMLLSNTSAVATALYFKKKEEE